jgi:hypothetical protein
MRNTEDYDDEGVPIPTVKLYPSRLIGRKKLPWDAVMPYRIYRVYDQVHEALCTNLNILVGTGIRAVVEAVCTDQGLNKGNLESKIDGLVDEGVITKRDAGVLHSLRFMGNAAAHEVKAHTTEELSIALQIVEHVLTSVYTMPDLAQKLPKVKIKARP